MYRLSYLIGITISLVIFIPLSSEHYIWPLSYCVLADICNHTWIPECGNETTTSDKRLFIDECDMYEYNCDRNRTYEITNYTDCFGPATGCPTLPSFRRRGNYEFVLEGRKMIYAPTIPHTHQLYRIVYPQTKPVLPPHMLHGKRRYTPEVLNNRRQMRRFLSKRTQNRPLTTKRRTAVLKRITVMKNGKMMVKVVKGFADTDDDSDFLE